MTAIAGVLDFARRGDSHELCVRIVQTLKAPWPGAAANHHRHGDHGAVAALGSGQTAWQPHPAISIAADLPSGVRTVSAAGLLENWAARGTAAVRSWNGDFAVGIVDHDRRRLFLVRDIAGSRPLFFTTGEGFAAFASMPRSLACLGPGGVDLDNLALRMLGLVDLQNRSCWQNVRKVEAGTTVELSEHGIQVHRHFEPLEVPFRNDSESILADMFRERLDDAVESRLPPDDAIVGCHLSSGFDTNAVLATATRRKLPAQQLACFTAVPSRQHPLLVPRGRIPDESLLAARAARAAGASHVIVEDRSRIVPSLRGMAAYFDSPVPNPINQGWGLAVASAARDSGAKVLLRGALGNATISFGSLPVLAHWIATGRWTHWAQEAIAAKQLGTARWRGILVNSFGPWVPARLLDLLYALAQGSAPYSAHAFVRQEVAARLAGDHPSTFGTHSDPRAVRAMIIRNYDSAEYLRAIHAMTSVEERDPTGDRQLVEFCFSLPPERLFHQGEARALARAALADRVPGFILNEPLRGFQGADFYGRISKSEAMEAVEEISTCDQANALIDLPRLRAAIEKWPEFDPSRFGELFGFVRHVTNALAVGLFLLESRVRPERQS